MDMISPDAIRAAREAAGLSVIEAAAKAGLTRATIYNVEKGDRSPSGAVLVALARVYGVQMESFVVHNPDASEASHDAPHNGTRPIPTAH